ncbi:GNAT family N-acetyltransferase [Nocardia farcinica]|uniref:GNAT family N-acetyltransferase n=1 Tax=Nocardia farcinica TaxID=37329 RepID=UPI001895CEA8|nr:GNAT family N-acetyltransferase [Nocardia farcinica]MBF6261401.1 GNAT family N-acetyltransferase [Nocardia farcinica]MBF6278930.1 GNAT family N-acetyltransferase [Nocardia farcinica]MBF6304412.1 GNAT family N-acetyltransferase [Nocardia farcinica]MBF6389453.1 GNAT family N-acetyltransferase [Nocardia farcinica]MBF6491540.1 GNAT family N-acetyltransferase [Nocardia farcinica]
MRAAHPTVREFTRADWPWLSAWYADETLNEQLGPLDQEWLDHVLADDTGVELVVALDGAPVASIGCVWADGHAESDHTVTALAVDPGRRRQGLATLALEAALGWPGHPPAAGWRVYVDLANLPALAFFRRRGWLDLGVADDMRTFRWPGPAVSQQ